MLLIAANGNTECGISLTILAERTGMTVSSLSRGNQGGTQDIDLVVDPDQTSRVVDDFLKSLAESDFMFDESSVREAVKDGGIFQPSLTRPAASSPDSTHATDTGSAPEDCA